jgi:hypothetical protein
VAPQKHAAANIACVAPFPRAAALQNRPVIQRDARAKQRSFNVFLDTCRSNQRGFANIGGFAAIPPQVLPKFNAADDL